MQNVLNDLIGWDELSGEDWEFIRYVMASSSLEKLTCMLQDGRLGQGAKDAVGIIIINKGELDQATGDMIREYCSEVVSQRLNKIIFGQAVPTATETFGHLRSVGRTPGSGEEVTDGIFRVARLL